MASKAEVRRVILNRMMRKGLTKKEFDELNRRLRALKK